MIDSKTLIPQRDACKESWKNFAYNKTREWGLNGLDLGVHDLNLLLTGLLPRKVITIGARSGHGKTALTIPIIRASERIQHVHMEYCFFSWEMTSDVLVDRVISNETALTPIMLSQGAKLLSASQNKLVEQAYKTASVLPVSYQEHSTDISTVSKIWRKFCEEADEKHEGTGKPVMKVGIIDYVGMAQFQSAGLRTYGIGDFMNGLKKLANETGGSFIVLAQLKRESDDKAIPDRNDFKDSSDIENASDALIILHRPEYNGVTEFPNGFGDTKDKAMLRVLKNRMGAIGDMIINCEVRYNRFYSLNHTHDFKYWELYNKEDFWRSYFKI